MNDMTLDTAKHPDNAIRVIGWFSLVATAGWFLAPFTGVMRFSGAWGVVFAALLCAPLVIAGVHLGRAPHLSADDRERWSRGLLRFGPFVAWLYLITRHKGSA
jgi:hypothetical protein